jgi:ribosome-binding protein aMBF1 (putative translation factor)
MAKLYVFHASMHAGTDGPSAEPAQEATLHEARRRLAERMRSTRRQFGWSQQEAADRAGVTQSMWSRIEARERDPQLSSLLRIQHALGLASLEEFFGDAPTKRLFRAEP